MISRLKRPGHEYLLNLGPGAGGALSMMDYIYGEAPPEMGTFFGLEVYKRVGISRGEV